MNKTKRKLLLLEDDDLFAQTLVDFLKESNFDIDIAKDGEDALSEVYENHYDLYLFDINVPKLNGIELLKILREKNIKTPTIFLTSYNDDETLKKCFVYGCDDFLRKPFKVSELLLRIKAILKRTIRVENIINIGQACYYDFDNRVVYKENKELPLPLKVIQLLELFIEYNDKTITTDEIIDRLWSDYEEHSEGSVRLYITKVRNIVGKAKIINIKKVGYKISGIICDE